MLSQTRDPRVQPGSQVSPVLAKGVAAAGPDWFYFSLLHKFRLHTMQFTTWDSLILAYLPLRDLSGSDQLAPGHDATQLGYPHSLSPGCITLEPGPAGHTLNRLV